ncbi:adenylate/guanylate cyclase domain-containing protein [Paenibacillus sp. SYP-B3998]|uniref:Adenylate/guanylate cyclase domain-containing protein n=1 Tax=Paenibacillus sp. SYP-B3998 TaxID=2678564 RepID=A0A6G4A2L7_9BACL|nr:adenylate/guanylate cyclase domain-containing protein [Paenibacillus sp. SYP-B3998]NEW08713.1 adenylate/guanylate cyclase domain-containing protein [Paenibacillus sp. SYP-B3998]
MGKKSWIQTLTAGVILIMLSTYFYTVNSSGLFYFIEHPLQDNLRKAKSIDERQPEDRIKIIKIDEKSLAAIGKFPWDRKTYAQMIEKLEQSGAAAIGIDVVLAEPSKNPDDDKALADVLAKYHNVILPVQINYPTKQQQAGELVPEKVDYPSTTLTTNKEQMAHINVFVDKDGKARKLPVGLPDENQHNIPAFSVALTNLILNDEEKISYDVASRQWKRGNIIIPTNDRNQVTTEFYSLPRQKMDVGTGYETLSYIDVINSKKPLPLEGAIALVGPFVTAMQDEYPTPISSVKMFGIEIHANMIQTLIEGKFYRDTSKPIGIVIILVVALLALFLFERFKGRVALFLFVAMLVVYGLIWMLLYTIGSIFAPLVYPQFAIVAIYMWSLVSHYLKERMERNRVTGIFGRFVSKSVVDELLRSGEDVKLGGSRKDISLIFVDIRGFTPMSERLEPEQVIRVLNEYLDVCTKAIFKYNGTLDKFIGDGVMAMFGAPIEYDNHPEMAVRAAIEMKSQAGVLEQKLIEKYGIGVKFGLGINSGPAVVGNIGSEDLRLDYTAIGDTVNLSARLESNAKPGQILISELTYARVEGLFRIEPIGEMKVKGKEKPVMVYEVIGNL